jgi:DNA-3-methyladenine glycosylase
MGFLSVATRTPTRRASGSIRFRSIGSDIASASAPSRNRPLVLPRAFYERSPKIVARNLLGKLLVRNRQGKRLIGRITEVEAYLGEADPASHAFGGRSAYNSVLFGPAGHLDVYLIYGLHYCVNISCWPDGRAGGVLIRAIEPLEGIDTMAKLRGAPATSSAQHLTGGPGRLCQALGITRAKDYDIDVTEAGASLQVMDDGHPRGPIEVTPRIGLVKAADLKLRFVVAKTTQREPS